MMDDQAILAMIREALDETVPERRGEFEALTLDDPIRQLGIDSILIMEMIGEIEDRLERTFREEELARARTLGDLASLIRHGRVVPEPAAGRPSPGTPPATPEAG